MLDGERLICTVLALVDIDLRRGYVHSLLAAACTPRPLDATGRRSGGQSRGQSGVEVGATVLLAHTAEVLEAVCRRADSADPRAEETLLSIVDALFFAYAPFAFTLRVEALRCGHWSLERLVRHSAPPMDTKEQRRKAHVKSLLATDCPSVAQGAAQKEAGIPDYGKGRPLALGERKALARKPTRALMDRLLCDPHPEVVRRLLANPRLAEDDAVRVASRRQRQPDVLSAVAESPRWLRSRRVRIALACNPDSPVTIGIRVVRLLLRADLNLVASSPRARPEVRQVCFELLARRPPLRSEPTHADREKLH